jgi:hypothetical protein
MGALGITTHTLASAVADEATVAIAYPTGTTQASLTGSTGGVVSIDDGAGGTFAQGAGGFTVVFDVSTITITNDSNVTWPAGAVLTASFGKTSYNGSYNWPAPGSLSSLEDRVDAVELLDAAQPIEELTATGAVTAGVRILELNHGTVAIAATIADAEAHKGLFIIRNTSASGTAAHTVTLTAGTFDGTNDVATLDAPGEALVVLFDETGRGQIVENTGSVVLS